MKTVQEIKTDIDVLVRKQGNQGAVKLGYARIDRAGTPGYFTLIPT